MCIVKANPAVLTNDVVLCKESVVVTNLCSNLAELDSVLSAAGAEIVPLWDNITEMPEESNLGIFPVRDFCDTANNADVERGVIGMYNILGFYKTAATLQEAFELNYGEDETVTQCRAAYALEFLRRHHAEMQWTATIESAAKWYAATNL